MRGKMKGPTRNPSDRTEREDENATSILKRHHRREGSDGGECGLGYFQSVAAREAQRKRKVGGFKAKPKVVAWGKSESS